MIPAGNHKQKRASNHQPNFQKVRGNLSGASFMQTVYAFLGSQRIKKPIQLRKKGAASEEQNFWRRKIDGELPIYNLLVPVGLAVRKAVLVHDPAAPKSLGCFPHIEHQSLLQPDGPVALNAHHPICPCGLPVAWWSDPVRSVAVAVLAVSWHVEEPLLVPNWSQSCCLCRASMHILDTNKLSKHRMHEKLK